MCVPKDFWIIIAVVIRRGKDCPANSELVLVCCSDYSRVGENLIFPFCLQFSCSCFTTIAIRCCNLHVIKLEWTCPKMFLHRLLVYYSENTWLKIFYRWNRQFSPHATRRVSPNMICRISTIKYFEPMIFPTIINLNPGEGNFWGSFKFEIIMWVPEGCVCRNIVFKGFLLDFSH